MSGKVGEPFGERRGDFLYVSAAEEILPLLGDCLGLRHAI